MIETWLEDQGIERAWELTPALAEAGVTEHDLATIAGRVPATALPGAVAWITDSLGLRESTEIIAQGSRTIAELVQAIKGYSHMDPAIEHDADNHDGLENTLIILAHWLRTASCRQMPAVRLVTGSPHDPCQVLTCLAAMGRCANAPNLRSPYRSGTLSAEVVSSAPPIRDGG